MSTLTPDDLRREDGSIDARLLGNGPQSNGASHSQAHQTISAVDCATIRALTVGMSSVALAADHVDPGRARCRAHASGRCTHEAVGHPPLEHRFGQTHEWVLPTEVES